MYTYDVTIISKIRKNPPLLKLIICKLVVESLEFNNLTYL